MGEKIDLEDVEQELSIKKTLYLIGSGRKSIRQSTAVKSAETLQRIKIRSELKKKNPKKVEEHIPTQEELLAEAVITEEENLKSLGKYKT